MNDVLNHDTLSSTQPDKGIRPVLSLAPRVLSDRLSDATRDIRLRAFVAVIEQLIHHRGTGLEYRPQLVAVHELRDCRTAVADQL